MKQFHLLLVMGCVLGVAMASYAIPAAAQKEIDQLVQQDKFTEALAKVDALLKDQPTDKDLLDLKAQLEKSAKPAAPPEKPAVSKLEMTEIKMIYKDAMAQPEGSPERAKFMRELLDKSAPLVKRDENLLDVWAARAQAALDLNLPLEGNDAATHLMKLGAAESDNEMLVSILANVKRKGWMDANEAKKASEAEQRKAWWLGKWSGQATFVDDIENNVVHTVKLEFQKNGLGQFSAKLIDQLNLDREIHTKTDKTIETRQVPGDYASDSTRDSAVLGWKKLVEDRGTTQIKETAVSDNGNQITIRYEISLTSSLYEKRAWEEKIIAIRNGDYIEAHLYSDDPRLKRPVMLKRQ